MHNPLKSWKPLPAAKPSHLATGPADQTTVSLAALKGATSAFASSSTTSLPDVGELRRRYESTGTNAGPVPRGRPVELQPDDHGASEEQASPPRGRHLSPEDAVLAGARSATNNKSTSSTAGGLDRSPSMIAARLVSASPSPVRGRSTASPPEIASPGVSRVVRPPLSTSGSLSNKILKASSPTRTTQPGEGKAVIPSLDLDKAPVLSPSLKNSSTQNYQRAPAASTRPEYSQDTPVLNHVATISTTRPKDAELSSSPIAVPRMKPPAPAPRKGRPLARSPLQADLTGPRSAPGISREEVINRMADAMVASSLASTRPSSLQKRATGAPEIRRSESAHASYRTAHTASPMLPAPAKPIRPMKHTLRKESPEDEEDENKRGRRHLVRKHPNMHHEGDRKRWRDKVTESERRRYEGVFAANRGLHLRAADARASPSRLMDPNAESNHVVNLVVRDIWERSRLPAHILEQIYDLVAPDEARTLSREQFVVGLWLIDQKLKGRKLPVKVSESVWASVRHTHGITMGH